MKQCFAPVFTPTAKVLILGSLPGEASLAQAQYYAHPRNGFWLLIGDVLDFPVADLPYELRLNALQSRGVALWDVVAKAERRGSLDHNLRDVEPNSLARLIAALPELRIIAFNGQAAATIGLRQLPTAQRYIVLPSSSPANTMRFEQKLEAWRALRPLLRP